jgi:hypothetical protein
MIQLILFAVLLLLILIGGIAVALFHFFGWKGMVAFPFVVLVFVWLGKFLIGKLIKQFALSLFSMKSKVLRGASMKVHSITAVAKPVQEESGEDEEEDDESEDSEEEDEAEKDGEEEDGEEDQAEEEDEEEKPRHYYEVDLTITPRDGNADRVWEPGEFILVSEPIKSLADLEEGEKEVGLTHDVRVWNGTEFGSDDPGKYPGEQRLKLTFALTPGTTKAWLQYYNEPIGSLVFPAWNPQIASPAA